jgi:tRNA/tmRNA/rRNA uracil-C5-methylase (TrmA/RlmC/RlmD family)
VRLPSGVDAGMVVDGRTTRPPRRIRHQVLGRSFEVSAGVFWQVHPSAAETLARAVLDGLAPKEGDKVLDLYAGAALFSALLAETVGASGSVLAVEGHRRAAADASRNTADQPNVRVLTAGVDPEVIAAAGRQDLVVLDPPRAGAGRAVTEAVLATGPRSIAYVACDPASFARDLRVVLDAGWALSSLSAFDLFPMTEHVEIVAILQPG